MLRPSKMWELDPPSGPIRRVRQEGQLVAIVVKARAASPNEIVISLSKVPAESVTLSA